MKKRIDTISEMEVASIFIQREDVGGDYAIIYNTLNKDTSNSELEAVQFIYRQFVELMHRIMKQPVVSLINYSSVINVMILVK